MIHRLQEIQSIFISQNRLVEGKDYKRAEWLKGTGGCYIDTLINPAWNDQLSATTEVEGQPTVNNPCILYASGSNTRVGMLLGGAWYKNNTTQFIVINRVVGTNDYIEWRNFPANAELYASFKVVNNSIPTVSFKVNGASLTHKDINGSNIITELPDTTYKIGDAAANGLDVLNLKNVKINSHNFIPCQLLRSIPATLDANNIARTAGECGMVDSISGKFYGNVASSGSFSVEGLDESGTVEDTRLHQIYKNKLVEGEDYTLGEMLKGDDNSPYISIPNLQNFNLEAHRTTSNNHTLIEGTYTQYQGTTYTAYINYINQINRTTANVTAGVFKATVAIGNDVTIEKRYKVGYDALKFNGANCVRNAREPVYNGIDLRTVTKLLANANSYIVSLKGNKTYANSDEWKYTFVPCKLLRPIPRNLDAQCKSRVAGECGMIDLISGRFYGNVSSSGTFSLAWDEWLKDCSIQFDANYLGWTMQYPPTISYQGRIKVANLPDELTDFGFVKLSKTQVVMGENVWSFNNWGSGTWASFDVSYGGGYGCGCSINGSSVGSQQEQVATELSCSIDLQDIIQINKIEFIAYIDQQTTHTVKFTRGFDETLNKQYLISDYDNTRIYAD